MESSKCVLYIGNKLSKHGVSVTSIETLGVQIKSLGLTVYYSSSVKNKVLRLFDMLRSIFKYRKKVDTVLIDTYSRSSFWFAYFSALLCQQLNIQYVPILRGGGLPMRLKNNKKECDRIFLHSKANIAPSNYLLEAFKQAGYSVDFIPNNINLDIYPYKKRSDVRPKLLWVRGFANLYNPQMAISVLEELRKKYNDASLCMIGPDKDGSMQECKALAKEKGIDEFVTFTGRLSKEEWHKKSEEYDIFFNTTNVDNTPISVIEAMALGLPVVSTNVGGIPYLLDDNKDALLVPAKDLDKMVASIERLLDDQKLVDDLTSKAREKVNLFDWNVVKDQWLSVV